MLCARVPHAVCASAPTGASTSTRTRRRLPLPRAGASVSGNESTRLLPLLPEECHLAVTRATAIGGHHMHSNPTHPSPVLRCSADGLAVSGPELSWENEGGHLRAPRGCREMSSRPPDAEARNRLADEHALLLHQVAARADDVLAALAASRWPRLELAGLIDNLRSELIGQTRIRGTTAVHRRRHHFGRRLGPGPLATTSGCGAPWKPALTPEPPVGGGTAGACRDRSRPGHSLTAHLLREEEVLSRYATSVGRRHAVAAMEQHPHAWYPLTHGPSATSMPSRPRRPSTRSALASGSCLRSTTGRACWERGPTAAVQPAATRQRHRGALPDRRPCNVAGCGHPPSA